MGKRSAICFFIICIVQIVILSVLAYLEYLSEYRAGLMQHLYYNKFYYQNRVYTETLLPFHGAALYGFPVLLFFLYKKIGRKLSSPTLFLYSVTAAAVAIVYFSPACGDLNIFAYLLLALEGITAFNFIYLTVSK